MFKDLPKVLKNLKECIAITKGDAKDVQATIWRLDVMIMTFDLLLKASSLKEAVAITEKALITISKKGDASR